MAPAANTMARRRRERLVCLTAGEPGTQFWGVCPRKLPAGLVHRQTPPEPTRVRKDIDKVPPGHLLCPAARSLPLNLTRVCGSEAPMGPGTDVSWRTGRGGGPASSGTPWACQGWGAAPAPVRSPPEAPHPHLLGTPGWEHPGPGHAGGGQWGGPRVLAPPLTGSPRIALSGAPASDWLTT